MCKAVLKVLYEHRKALSNCLKPGKPVLDLAADLAHDRRMYELLNHRVAFTVDYYAAP